jgi:hypothetical protein
MDHDMAEMFAECFFQALNILVFQFLHDPAVPNEGGLDGFFGLDTRHTLATPPAKPLSC